MSCSGGKKYGVAILIDPRARFIAERKMSTNWSSSWSGPATIARVGEVREGIA